MSKTKFQTAKSVIAMIDEITPENLAKYKDAGMLDAWCEAWRDEAKRRVCSLIEFDQRLQTALRNIAMDVGRK